ncbi:MAG: UDP-2,3-diacylglucosamine diphosphatase [Alistipes sp.]
MYYFASDIHLGGGDAATCRRKESAFTQWLDCVSADAEAIFLLGDMFDFWFEYQRVVPKGFVRTLGKLAELTDRGIRIVFFTGNHDMWVGDYLHKECGLEIHTHPEVMELAGKRLFLAHGDNMNIDHLPALRLLNAVFRSKTLRFLFSWLIHPDLAMKFGLWWSANSRQTQRHDRTNTAVNQPLINYAVNHSASHPDIDYYLFGHMHREGDFCGQGVRVMNLGDWNDQPTYAVLDSEGRLALKAFKV